MIQSSCFCSLSASGIFWLTSLAVLSLYTEIYVNFLLHDKLQDLKNKPEALQQFSLDFS